MTTRTGPTYAETWERLYLEASRDRDEARKLNTQLLKTLHALVEEHYAPKYAPGKVRTAQWDAARALLKDAKET